MNIPRTIAASTLALGIGITAERGLADTVILKNGDVLNGKVLALDTSELKFQSHVLGQLSLARENIVTIHLGDQPLLKPASVSVDAGAPQAPIPAGPATAPLAMPEGMELPKADSVEEALRQLQLGGVDAETLQGLQGKLPLLATPEVKGYFDEKVRGLMSGNLTVQDLRQDAINARDQLRDLQQDLGPQATDALAPYLSILESFIRKTEPAATIQPPSVEKPAADP